MNAPQKRLSHDIFAENLETLMQKKDLSDIEVGRRIGVTRTTVWRWRKGKQEPLGTDRDALADALGVPVYRLFRAG